MPRSKSNTEEIYNNNIVPIKHKPKTNLLNRKSEMCAENKRIVHYKPVWRYGCPLLSCYKKSNPNYRIQNKTQLSAGGDTLPILCLQRPWDEVCSGTDIQRSK